MTGETIKQFLVGLGYDIDEAGLAKFNKSIALATVKVTALYAGVKIAAAGIGYGISKISEDFEQLGYQYRIIAPQINKAIILRRELFKAYNAAGINITNTVLASLKLNMSLTKTKYILDALYKSVGARFFGALTKQSDLFRQKIYQNLPKIQRVLESFVHFVFKALEATTELGSRIWSVLGHVYDFFAKLDEVTGGWSTKVLAAIAIWKLLNLSFLATPLGMIITGLLSIIALYDDFKVWQEGGKSLFDWGSTTTKTIVGLTVVVAGLVAEFWAAGIAIKAWGIALVLWNNIARLATVAIWAIDAAMAANPVILITAGVLALIGALTLLITKWDTVKRAFAGGLSGIGENVLNFIGGDGGKNLSTNLSQGPASTGLAGAALGSNTSNAANSSQTNVNANLQTNVNIQGVPDASSVGQHVTDQQSKNVFDLIRNMQGAIKAGGAIQ